MSEDVLKPCPFCEQKDARIAELDFECAASMAEIAAGRERAEKAEALVPEWQPIATAPRDGMRILCGRFVDHCPYGHNGLVAVDWYRTNALRDGYIGFGHFNKEYWPATHWMHLPKPPKANGAE